MTAGVARRTRTSDQSQNLHAGESFLLRTRVTVATARARTAACQLDRKTQTARESIVPVSDARE
jgi:hypothetical protein